MMRENGLQVRPLRRFVRTTQSDHQDPIFPDLARGFIPKAPDQLWVCDLGRTPCRYRNDKLVFAGWKEGQAREAGTV
jgi:hypothetical protein